MPFPGMVETVARLSAMEEWGINAIDIMSRRILVRVAAGDHEDVRKILRVLQRKGAKADATDIGMPKHHSGGLY